MGLYFRTLEMSRHRGFACFRCGPASVMRERLVGPNELELTCDTCALVLLVVTTDTIPRHRADLRGVIRYRPGGAPLAHGEGFRCHNCGRRLAYSKEGRGPHQCPRCHTWHYLGTVSTPPRSPRVLRSTSAVSSSRPATPVSSGP